MKLLIFLLLICISACNYVDHKYLEYVERFEKEFKPISVTIVEDNFMSSAYYGVCYRNATRYIHINNKKWEDLSYMQKEILIFHELGHCVLNKEHGTGIMLENSVDFLIDYEENRKMYIKELLEGSK